jgi:hypothetical protein
MTSGNAALTTIAPQARQLTLAGHPVSVGKLKLRQRAELQHWLDAQPEPNERVRAALTAEGLTAWPIGVEHMPFLLDVDYDARLVFLRVTLGPFNPGLTSEDIGRLAGDCDDDDELLAIIFAAYGHDPSKIKRGPTPDPKGDAVPVEAQT